MASHVDRAFAFYQRVPYFGPRTALEDLDQGADAVEEDVRPDHDMGNPEHGVALPTRHEDLEPVEQDGYLQEHDDQAIKD